MALGMHDTGSTRAGPLGPDLDRDGVAKAYGRWAPVYDLVFGPVFAQGRTLAAAAAERIGGRILEVGVGTGLSLPAYRRARSIVGIDISAPMLEKARQRVARLRLRNVERLAVMDAEQLDFPDASGRLSASTLAFGRASCSLSGKGGLPNAPLGPGG